MSKPLHWGIIGTGAIADDFATALRGSESCRVINAVGSAPGRSAPFAAKFGLPAAARTLDELLADQRVEAVYIATPHPLHEQHALAAIKAGKHVLCEKPITVDAAGAQRVIDAARVAGVFLMEAFMYRCHPLTHKMIDQLQQGAIGRIRHVRANFGFYMQRDPDHRLFNPDLAGGGILDVGGYPVSFARLIAGVAAGKEFEQPCELHAAGQIGPTGVDELAIADLRFPSGVTAQISAAVHHDLGTGVTIFGDEGHLYLPDPWIPQSNRHGLTSSFTVHRRGREPQTHTVTTDKATYAIEAQLVADSLPNPQPAWPAMRWDDTLGNMRVLDAWRQQLHTIATHG